MLLEMLFEVEKSENFVKIGPKTAEIQVFEAKNRGVIRGPARQKIIDFWENPKI